MDVAAIQVSKIIKEINEQRNAQGLSYQAIADACEVSQTTIIRILKGETEPTVTMLQSIAAAVQYKQPPEDHSPPSDIDKDKYIEYLRFLIRQQTVDHDRHSAEMRTHYSMLHRQDRRTITLLAICVAILVIFLVTWLVFDILHPEIGWIRQ